MEVIDNQNVDICRVCRCEATPDKPLFHPCICTGSIKYIHQECLMQWLRYSEKEFCELCNYRFSFIPIYSPDMPQRLPLRDIFSVIARCAGTVARYWLQYTLVAIAWLVIIPLTAYRIYMFLFNYSFDDLLSLTFEFSKTENLFSDGVYGCCVVMCTLFTFIFLIWLREQIIRVGAPDWLERPINFDGLQALFRMMPRANHVAPIVAAPGPVEVNQNANDQLNDAQAAAAADAIIANNNNDIVEEGNGEVDNMVIDDNEDEIQPVHVENHDLFEQVQDLIGAEVVVAEPNEPAAVAAPIPEAPAAEVAVADVPNPVAVAQDWNPVIEWDRGAEDITWERILGLDGTFAFLENVFWVITLNSLFIFIFAYLPYHLGAFVFKKLTSAETFVSEQFDRMISIFTGYLVIGVLVFGLHLIFSLTRFTRVQRFFGFCYLIIKVALLVSMELGFFPEVVGWWLDICSLPIFGTTLQHRIDRFYQSPGSSLFVHWLVGMICVFYFVSFVLMLKETLRPGMLWFFRNLNDPNFNPVTEMIHLPVLSHLTRCTISLAIFCFVIMLIIYLPIWTLQKVWPGFFPYSNITNNESPFELILELFIFRVLLPNVIEASDYTFRQLIRSAISNWCHLFAYLLDLKSFLLGDRLREQEMHEHHEDETLQVYTTPRWFLLRLTTLLVCFCSTLFFFGLFMLTIPVLTGREVLEFVNHHIDISDIRVNEFYTAAVGIYVNLLAIQLASRLVEWLREITRLNRAKILRWVTITCKLGISGILLFGIIPLMVGVLFELIILMPLRVPVSQTPIIYLWQDYAFGILLSNVICVIKMMSDLRFKDIMEQIYANGLANTNLKLILYELAFPNISLLGIMIAAPYMSAKSLLLLLHAPFELDNYVIRRIHLAVTLVLVTYFGTKYQIKKFYRFYEHIRNDKYLVGRRLVNYDHSKQQQKTTR